MYVCVGLLDDFSNEASAIYRVFARSSRSPMNFDMSDCGRLQTDSNLCIIRKEA